VQVQQLRQALQNGEGCNVAGYLEVERVSGNFHVSTHSHSFHVLEAVLQVSASSNPTSSRHHLFRRAHAEIAGNEKLWLRPVVWRCFVLQNNHASLNVSHIVHSLSFGPPFPGVVNPLDNSERMLSKVRDAPPVLNRAGRLVVGL
jgi:hypothetical protein